MAFRLVSNLNPAVINASGIISAGVSNLGNTSGTTGLVSNQLVLAGGNNITLSQSTNGHSATVTISAGAAGGGLTGSGNTKTLAMWGTNTSSLENSPYVVGSANQLVLGSNYLEIAETADDPPDPPADTLRVYAREETDLTRLRIKTPSGDIVTLAQDNNFVARNQTGVTIPKGKAVYVSGVSGSTPLISLAKADADATMPAVGLTLDDIAHNAFGRILYAGVLTNVNTTGFTLGDRLFVSATTAGDLTATEPTHPNLRQRVAIVTNVGANGRLLVFIVGIRGDHSGTNQNAWIVGDAAAGAKSVRFRNVNSGDLAWNPSANRTMNIPDADGTLLHTQSTQYLAITLGGNTAGTTSFNATDNASIFLHGGNNITLSGNVATITISALNTAPVVSNALQDVSTATGSGTNTSRFAADDHVHRGLRAFNVQGIASTFFGDFQLSAGNSMALSTAGNSTAGTVAFHNLISSGGGIQDISTATASGTGASIFARHDHVHRGLRAYDVQGVASTFFGNFQMSAGNNMSLATAGNTTAGTVQFVNVLSTGGVLQDVTTATVQGTGASLLARADHQHRGIRGIAVSGTASTFFGDYVLSAGPNITLVTGGNSTAGNVQISAAAPGAGAAVSFGVSTGGNTLGTTGMADRRLVLVGGANITLSQSLDAANSSATVTISAPNPGGGAGVTMSHWDMWSQHATASAVSSHAPASWVFNPFYLPSPLTMSYLYALKSFNIATSTSSNSSGVQSWSYSAGLTIFRRVDSLGNSSQLTTVTTASYGLSASRSHTSNNNSITARWVTDSTGGTSSFSTQSAGVAYSSLFTGMRLVAYPLVTSLSEGQYFIAYRHSTTTATAGSNTTLMSVSNLQHAVQENSFFRDFGTGAGQSSWAMPAFHGFGIASNITTNATMNTSIVTATTRHLIQGVFMFLPRLTG